jgi:hypothetical protein
MQNQHMCALHLGSAGRGGRGPGAVDVQAAAGLLYRRLAARAQLPAAWALGQPHLAAGDRTGAAHPHRVVVVRLVDLVELAGHPVVEDGAAPPADLAATEGAEEGPWVSGPLACWETPEHAATVGAGTGLQAAARHLQPRLQAAPQDPPQRCCVRLKVLEVLHHQRRLAVLEKLEKVESGQA